jgi:hypothetical protein
VPQSQKQAQDTIRGCLQRTIDALPPGTALDGARYAGAGKNRYCDDNASSPDAPMRFHTIGDLKLPSDDDDPVKVVATVGDIWRSWGWHVFERDGFRKPNQFGYAPDGYRLQIGVPGREGYPPSIQAHHAFRDRSPATMCPSPLKSARGRSAGVATSATLADDSQQNRFGRGLRTGYRYCCDVTKEGSRRPR